MRYIEYHIESPLLKKYIDCFWEISFPTSHEFTTDEIILPDGGVEWVFNLGTPYERKSIDGITKSISNSEIIGQRVSPVEVKQKSDTHLFAIRFKPYGIHFLGFKESFEIVNSSVEGGLCFGDFESQIFDLITDEINAKTIEKVELLLQQNINHFVTPEVLEKFWCQAVQYKGNIEIEKFRDKTSFSKAQFHRIFRKYIGVSPKKLCSILQFNSMLNEMHLFQSFTEAGLEHNYYDQSHMIKKFKFFTGVTPSQFFKENLHIYKTLQTIEKNRLEGISN